MKINIDQNWTKSMCQTSSNRSKIIKKWSIWWCLVHRFCQILIELYVSFNNFICTQNRRFWVLFFLMKKSIHYIVCEIPFIKTNKYFGQYWAKYMYSISLYPSNKRNIIFHFRSSKDIMGMAEIPTVFSL